MLDAVTESVSVDVDLGPLAHILVVDDNALNRKKMQLAVKKLGHYSKAAASGIEALAQLREHSFDAILLDIVMPEMDGFAVLKVLKADPELRDIPVIVVSTLDEQTESVVRAIELGAEDVLPKDFNPVLLRARLGASLSKKRYRDKEVEYLRRVDALTTAAEVLESGNFETDSLKLDRLAQESDSLGKLAAVFRGMAREIYEREFTLRRRIHLLQGAMLVIAVGVVWGLTPSLSRIASGTGTTALGLAVWVNFLGAAICLAIAGVRGKLTRLSLRELGFFVVWAVLAGVLQRFTTFWVSAHVEASLLSLIVTLQGFLVFGFAALTGLERASAKRLIGLMVGLCGVGVVLASRVEVGNGAQNLWLLAATLLPLLFAIEAIVLAGKRPQHLDMFASVGYMYLISTVILIPIAGLGGELFWLEGGFGKREALIALLACVSMVSLTLAFHLIATAGSVFYSQSAYTMTLAGIVWGMLLLNEALPLIAWFGFLVIVIGMYLVEPKPSTEKLVINRSFT